MRRFPIKSLLALAAAGFSALALPSCATNDSMIYIIGVAARQQGACTVKADLNATLQDKGALDRTFASEYVAALMIGNQIMQRGSRERVRTETSKVALKGAEVTLEDTQGNSLVPAFSAIGTGFVDASDGSAAAPAVMFASLIPSSVAGALPPGTVVAKVRVFGTTLGGEDVESSELSFPIVVCDGCLVSYPAAARDPAADPGAYQCKLTGTDMAAAGSDTASLPCALGIDLPAPCTVCSGLFDACLTPDKNCYYTPNDNNCPKPP
jgi:hypothetical protein